jgi:hypothetical protein
MFPAPQPCTSIEHKNAENSPRLDHTRQKTLYIFDFVGGDHIRHRAVRIRAKRAKNLIDESTGA